MTTNEKPKFRVVDNPGIPDLYANKLIGAMYDGGAITLSLGTTRLIPRRTDEGPSQGDRPEVYISARLAISPAAAIEIINSLSQVLGVIASQPNQNKLVPVQAPGQQAH